MPFIITELYAFVIEGDDGEEGIMGFHSKNGWVPMIGADMARVEALREIAKLIADSVGKPYTIKYFKLDPTH